MREFLAAPPEIQAAFMGQVSQAVEAVTDFDRWHSWIESGDPVEPPPISTRLARRWPRWDAIWKRKVRWARRPHRTDATIDKDEFLEIPAAEYVAALTGEDVASGRICCPLPDHDDSSGDFAIYDETWRCFGCNRGGHIFELAGLLWGIDRRSKRFPEILERLRAVFA